MELTVTDVLWRLAAVLVLVFANGFFVAAEFAIVSVRKTRVDQLIAEGHRGRARRAPRRHRSRQLHRRDAARHHDGEPRARLDRRTGARLDDRAGLPFPAGSGRRDHRAQHRRGDCFRDRDGAPHRVRRAGSQDDRARTSRKPRRSWS